MTAHGRVRDRGRQALALSRGRKPIEDVLTTQYDSFHKGDVSWFSDLFGKGILAANGDNRNRRHGPLPIVPERGARDAATPSRCDRSAILRPSSLRRELRTFKTGSTFVDTHTGHARFQVTTKLLSGRLTLLDATNNALIATFKQKFAVFSSPAFKVHVGSDSDAPELFQIHAEFRRGNRTKVRVKFTNMWAHERCELGFEGNWCHRDGFFWLDRGLKGVRKPVAKLTHLKGFASHTVQMDIAPNMDTSLIAIVCTTLSTQEREADDHLRHASSAVPPS